MSVNTLNFEQISTVLTSIVQQATGQAVQTPTDTGSFVSVAQVALRADRDSVMQAISNILARTIFSIRPYSAKMTGLEMDTFRWGGMMRKLSIADSDWQDDPAFKYPVLFDSTQNPANGDGGEVDPWKIKKPDIIQTNFYGQSVYYDSMTITEDQLETAFTGPEQMGGFISAIFGEVRNAIEIALENLGRACINNFIANTAGTAREIKLVTEYNGLGGNVTAANALTNKDFLNYAFRRINEHIDYFQDMSTMFNDGTATRHTPKNDIRIKLLSPFVRAAETVTQYAAFHETLVDVSGAYTPVSYWQGAQNRSQIKVQRSSDDAETTVSNVIGVMHDRDALGIYQINETVATTPINAAGLYYNQYYHERQLWFNDLSENFIIFTLN